MKHNTFKPFKNLSHDLGRPDPITKKDVISVRLSNKHRQIVFYKGEYRFKTVTYVHSHDNGDMTGNIKVNESNIRVIMPDSNRFWKVA
ncbi:hypothetical protein [Caudoviricetes sp.]|nr:hypothetical protein [Caudoviricetes sp.]